MPVVITKPGTNSRTYIFHTRSADLAVPASVVRVNVGRFKFYTPFCNYDRALHFNQWIRQQLPHATTKVIPAANWTFDCP